MKHIRRGKNLLSRNIIFAYHACLVAILFLSYDGVEGFHKTVSINQILFLTMGRKRFDNSVNNQVPSTTRRLSKKRRATIASLSASRTDIASNDERKFDVNMALFCAGLAFDAYVEPDPDSSRWERGSKGMNVAFVSSAYTRNLYKGMVEIKPIECTDLPEDDDNVEKLTTGDGVDVCLMCAVVEGSLWKEDLQTLDEDPNHNGVMSLSGSAHVGRSRTAWANVDINKSKAHKSKNPGKRALPYHVPREFFKASKAVWPEDERPFYLYVQDPENVRLVFSLFDDDVIGEGSIISSMSIPLKKLLPRVGEDLVETVKNDVIQSMVKASGGSAAGIDCAKLNEEISRALSKISNEDYKWEGELKMTTKPKVENKNGQIATGAAAGAMVAGPLGAAAGAAFGALYEGKAKGVANLRLRYLPVPAPTATSGDIDKYEVLGGIPGINWGKLYELNLEQDLDESSSFPIPSTLGGSDLEFCFFINHDQTGASVGVYRSLEEKRIVVSFRGTCQPVDLLTDASILQVPWVAGDYDEQELKKVDHETFPMVHVGFRKSLDSINRRLKTLVLAAVGEGELVTDYDLLVTGHSLGGALATLFTADIAEVGIDAGRSLPQQAPSEPWWKGIAGILRSNDKKSNDTLSKKQGPPRPKSLKMYNFGSPRVGNQAFANQFETYIEKRHIDAAYRIVNAEDIIARVPRPTAVLNVDYEHCGKTVLIEEPANSSSNENPGEIDITDTSQMIWIEGESEFIRIDPVRDIRSATKNILSEGTLLNDLAKAAQMVGATSSENSSTSSNDNDNADDGGSIEKLDIDNVFNQFTAVTSRLAKADLADLTSVVGIDKNYANREMHLAQSFLKGESLSHHMEDSYFKAMGRAVGFNTTVGEEIIPV